MKSLPRRKICIFTGTRAEYGLLRPLMDEIKEDRKLKLQIIVSGMHLLRDFGLTYKEIEKDGFIINEKIKILQSSDTPVGISKSIGWGLINFCKAYGRLKPDIIVILGDRFEALTAAIGAMLSRIPIAHISGGESTFGVIDEAMRHSITKMSHLHFTSIEESRKRVIQLGEQPEKVFNMGEVGLDNIRKLRLLSKIELEKELNFKFSKHNLLITFHPVTLENNTAGEQFHNILYVLDKLVDTNIIFTKSNADPGGRIINRMIDEYVSKNSHKASVFVSLGRLKYLSLMQYVDAIVGNSSSGIVEAPSFKIGTINIGDRQKGRKKAPSVIDCKPTKESIRIAVKKLYSEEFQHLLKIVKNPYIGDSRSARKIKDILKKFNLKNILKKEFYDISFRI